MPRRHLLAYTGDFAECLPVGCGFQSLVRVVMSCSLGFKSRSGGGLSVSGGWTVHTCWTSSQTPWRVTYLNNNTLATKVVLLHCCCKESWESENLISFFWTVTFLSPNCIIVLRSAVVDRLVTASRCYFLTMNDEIFCPGFLETIPNSSLIVEGNVKAARIITFTSRKLYRRGIFSRKLKSQIFNLIWIGSIKQGFFGIMSK